MTRTRDVPSPLVLVALGSNLGDSAATVHEALERLHRHRPLGFRASSLWRSSPVDCPPGSPEFINAAASFLAQPEDFPESLLAWLQELERRVGRRPKQVLNEPRPLDLDLIAFGSIQQSTPHLTVPHPRAHLRRFVLEPLAEVAPEFTPPGWTANVETTRRQQANPRDPSPPVRLSCPAAP